MRGGRLFRIARRPQGQAAFVHVRSWSLGGSRGTGSWATSGLGRHARVPCTLLPQTPHVDVQLGRPREDGLGAGPDLLPHPRLRTAGPVRHRPRPGAAAAPSPGSPASHGSSSTARTRDAPRPSPGRAHTAAPPPQPHRRFGGRSRRAVPARHRPHGPRLAANRPFLLLLAWPPAAATGCASIRVGHRAPSAAQIWIRGPPAIGWLPVLRFGHGISAPIPFIRRFVSVVMQLGRRVIECSRRSSGT